MQIAEFQLERYFARWEFAAAVNLCASDIEGISMREVLALADDGCRELWDGLTLGYTEASGMPLLREEIAGMYEAIAPEHVYTFSGAEEAIFVLMHALLEPGDHVVATWPEYTALHDVARSIGAQVDLLERREEHGWQLDLDAYRDALRPGKTKLVVLNYPHSPTGALPSLDAFTEAARLANDAGAHFFVDEVYRFLEHDEGDRLPAGADIAEHGISLGVLSKAFGLAGLRIGWLATRDAAVLRRCARIKDYTTICNSAPSEVLALIGLRARDSLLARSRELVQPNLELVDQLVRASPHLSWVRPAAGSVGFPRLVAEEPVERFTDALVRERGVLLLPGTLFGHTGNHFRIGTGRRNVPAGLELLGAFLEDHYGSTDRSDGA
ncbi:MAG: aminotransferase class I/II-fold pyridoxal phosphate-dependent enzyme [Actinomycetota bacterium]